MKLALVTVASIIAGAAAAPLSEDQYQFLFSKFTQQFDKKYEVKDIFTKYNTFKSNLDIIVAHNASGKNWSMGVNAFTDMTQSEFSQFMGLKVVETAPAVTQAPCGGNVVDERDFIDWNTVKGGSIMNPIKNQGSCGSCWAFAAMAPLETMVADETGKLYDLSEQELVDCAGGKWGNNGCNGGLMSLAYDYLESRPDICTTKGYPYVARDNRCVADSCGETAPVKVKGYTSVPAGDAAHIKQLQKGPIGVALAASSSAFQFYKDGVVDTCTDRSINHGVTMVSYGETVNKDGKTVQYYGIRNSWGSSWGNQGMILLLANGSPQCGLTTSSFDAVPRI